MKRVLICNSSANEVRLLRHSLERKFKVHVMSSWSSGKIDLTDMEAVIVDTNFTEEQGLDFIMEVNAAMHLPVLIITPPDDPHCAIEARRIGVFNYLVKTESLYSVIEIALMEAIEKFNDLEELKRTAVAQRNRIADLEREIVKLKSVAPSDRSTPAQAEDKKRTLLKAIVERLSKGEINLPVYPKACAKLSQQLRDQVGIGEIARTLEDDVAIAAKLIGVSNSARYMSPKPNQNIEQAISVLGLWTTKNYVDLIVSRGFYAAKIPRFQAALNDLWEHSVACAHAAHAIAELGNIGEADDVFTMGLLHDIGRLLLIQSVAEVELHNKEQTPLDDAELSEFLRQNSKFFGKKLLEIWKLPKSCIDAAQYNEAPDSAPAITKGLLSVHLGNLMAKKIGYGTFDQALWNAQAPRSAAILGIDLEALVSMEKDIHDQVRECCTTLN